MNNKPLFLIDQFNKNAIDFQISSLDDIDSNEKLTLLIYSIRHCFNSFHTFDSEGLLNSYYRTAILMFNNVEYPYLKQFKGSFFKRINIDDTYFMQKMGIRLSKSKVDIINQLLVLWQNKISDNIEFNLRGLEVLSRESIIPFNTEVISLVIKSLDSIINKAEFLLQKSNQIVQ